MVVMVTGGVRSGKSSFAQDMLTGDDVLYIATNTFRDAEMDERILLHKKNRNPGWKVLEAYEGLHNKAASIEHGDIMLDCVGALITAFLFESGNRDFESESSEFYKSVQDKAINELSSLKKLSDEKGSKFIAVTNETGFGLVPETRLGREFRDICGNVNKSLASMSDEVFLMVSGIPVRIK